MTDGTTNDNSAAPATDAVDAPGPPTTPLGDPPELAPTTPVILLADAPQPGHLTLQWRIVTFATWVGVILAMASVWNASVQLGLSTWWLGPRGEPQPRLVQLSPFLAPILMLLATINHVKWLGRLGILAALVLAGFALPDLGEFSSIAALELAIALAAGAVSAASFTGTYRTPA